MSEYTNCVLIGKDAEPSTPDADGELVFKSPDLCLRMKKNGDVTINDIPLEVDYRVYTAIAEAFVSIRRVFSKHVGEED